MTTTAYIGQPTSRVDGRAKVTGAAKYAAEYNVPNLTYGYVVSSAIALYLIYLLRTPIGWLCVATFVAVSVAAPVGLLERHMPRGAAIALVYLTLVLIPIGIGVILVPPAVTAGSDLVGNLPSYVNDVNDTVQESDTLRGLNEDYD